ncbi:MAG TPA: guanylate kinase [Bacillota bacterium]|jgi:guanylate kinase|nr:guanylate kinase [Fastidiosipila sp.]HPX93115.1 guanylate kinase [Bacillota bacterium]HQB81358.1 guanylate kinase [Bacillota bacterium]
MIRYERSLEEEGLIIVLSGPSGVGKNSIIDELRRQDPRRYHSVSMTTRRPRKDEEDGIAYHFTTRDHFEDLINRGEILEYDTYCGEYYGTPRAPVDRMIREKADILLDLTVKGALALKRNCPHAVLIFVTASTEDALRQRLLKRGTESAEEIDRRLVTAREELSRINLFDYWVVNDVIEEAAADVSAIMKAEKRRTLRFFVDECDL